MYIKRYQAVFETESGDCFTVNGAVADSPERAIELAQNHVAVKAGAQLLRVKQTEIWKDDLPF